MSDSLWGSPAIGVDGTIYLHDYGRKVFALHPDGRLKWSYATGPSVFEPSRSSPTLGADGTIYVGSGEGLLFALNSDGTLQWSYKTGATVHSSPAISLDGTVYVGSVDRTIYALSSSSWGLQAGPWPKFGHGSRNTGYATWTAP